MLAPFREMCNAAMDLCINAGIMTAALSDDRYPDTVRENWEERLQQYAALFQQEVENVQNFGESFD